MNKQNVLLEEYKALRGELNQSIQFATAIALPVVIGFIAYAVEHQSVNVLLAVAGAFLGISLYNTLEARKIRYIAAYIRVVIEPKIDGLQWETMLARRREVEGWLEQGNFQTYAQWFIFTLGTIGCLSGAWLFLPQRSALYGVYIGFIVVLLLLLAIVSVYTIRALSSNHSDTVKWKRIAELSEVEQRAAEEEIINTISQGSN